MLLDKYKRIITVLIFAFMTVSVFAADTSALVKKQLTAAEDAMDEGDIDTAYKKVNGALQMMNDETSSTLRASVISEAKLVYAEKLNAILEKYNGAALSDVTIMIEKYPDVKNTKIEKLLAQIEEKQKIEAENQRKAELAASEAAAQKRHNEEQQSIKQQTQALEKQNEALSKQAESNAELAESMKNQAEELAKSNENSEKNLKAIQEGFAGMQDSMSDQAEALKESSKAQARSTTIMVFSIVGIAVLILIIVFVVIIIARRSMKQQAERQEQYMQAFRLIAENTSNTNRIMLGGATDLYGQSAPLKLAGTSTWAPAAALPDVTFTPEDEEELKQLAVKCEEIGTQIDQVTNRKNNSKNVSELVYKLSMQLGLSQGNSMLNFCAAMIYDAGFLGVDPSIWTADTLTDEQKAEMHNHVNIAEKYLDFVPKKYWQVFDDASKKHHENMDGSGYPNGLQGDEIPQIARLIRVAETFVSMSSRRNYRQAMDKETAIEKLREQPQFYDSAVVDTLDQIV
jgi:HD-GYP domain-containing protein (c-di-GMP phosphodiesterase class II)